MPCAGNRDFQISARFGSWLTPLGPGVSAQAGTFCSFVDALCLSFRFLDFGEIWVLAHAFRPRSSAPGVSAKSLICFSLLVPYVGIAISSFRRDFAPGSRLSGPGVSA